MNAAQIIDDIKSFQAVIENDGENTPLEFLNEIHRTGLEEICPNLIATLKVFLTLPVTIASAGSSSSKLKLTENYLRTTMAQERLINFAVISIESELLDCILQETVMQLTRDKLSSVEHLNILE